MKQFDDNDCKNCEGTGSERSGVEYYGQYEIVGCDWCAGTGFDDIYLGVERLRTEISELRAKEDEVRIFIMLTEIQDELFDRSSDYWRGANNQSRGLLAILNRKSHNTKKEG